MDALAQIHEILDGKEWSPDTLVEIAEVVERNGFKIHDSSFYSEHKQVFHLGAHLYFDIEVLDNETVVCTKVTVVPHQDDPRFEYAVDKETGEEVTLKDSSYIPVDTTRMLDALSDHFSKWTIGDHPDSKVILSWES